MLRDEINKALDIFDAYQIPEDKQFEIIDGGVMFRFNYANPMHKDVCMNVLEFARFLEICKHMNICLDIEEMLKTPWDLKYESLIQVAMNFNDYINDGPKR